MSRINTINSIRALCEHPAARFSMILSGVCFVLTVALSSTQFDVIKDRVVDCMTHIATDEESRMNLIQAGARAAMSAAHDSKDNALEPSYVESTKPDRCYRHYRYQLRKLICSLAPQSHDQVVVECANATSIPPKAAAKPNTAVKNKIISKLAVSKFKNSPKLKVAKANTVTKPKITTKSNTISKPKAAAKSNTISKPKAATKSNTVAKPKAAAKSNTISKPKAAAK